ncbi:MAG: class I SAM-dependent methyltransferase [Alcanivorax sp.]|nr:class I SAM-dependent methyltransferase [Alcanivorax sp.]
MTEWERVLSVDGARAYYDRFGKLQDTQGFYEQPALRVLAAQAEFQKARRVFEFGCGTGKFAAELLQSLLPPEASYLGCDVSPVMVDLARRRLQGLGDRAQVQLSDGALRFPLADHSVDRVVASYVLDLLCGADIARFLVESRRVLSTDGRCSIASLSRGTTWPSRLVARVWRSVFRLRPSLVGGCRPIDLSIYVDPQHWRVLHRRVVTPFGVPTEVLTLTPTP